MLYIWLDDAPLVAVNFRPVRSVNASVPNGLFVDLQPDALQNPYAAMPFVLAEQPGWTSPRIDSLPEVLWTTTT